MMSSFNCLKHHKCLHDDISGPCGSLLILAAELVGTVTLIPCARVPEVGGGRGCPSTMKKRRHKHTYKLKFKMNEKSKWPICYPNAVKFRQKPFLQASGVPACAHPYILWCDVHYVGISSIKIDKLSQGWRTGGPELATALVALCPRGQECSKFFMFWLC